MCHNLFGERRNLKWMKEKNGIVAINLKEKLQKDIYVLRTWVWWTPIWPARPCKKKTTNYPVTMPVHTWRAVKSPHLNQFIIRFTDPFPFSRLLNLDGWTELLVFIEVANRGEPKTCILSSVCPAGTAKVGCIKTKRDWLSKWKE